MRGVGTIALLAATIGLAACGNTVNNTTTTAKPVTEPAASIDRWPGYLQKSYMGGCTGTGALKTNCICTLEWLERRYTGGEAIDLYNAGTLDYKAAARACL